VPRRGRGARFEITQVLNTHEHGDHIGGNGPMVAATGAKILAHANAGRAFRTWTEGLRPETW